MYIITEFSKQEPCLKMSSSILYMSHLSFILQRLDTPLLKTLHHASRGYRFTQPLTRDAMLTQLRRVIFPFKARHYPRTLSYAS